MTTNPVVKMNDTPMEEEGVHEISTAEVVQLFPALVRDIEEAERRLAVVRKGATAEKRLDLLVNDYLPFNRKLMRRLVTALAGATSVAEEALAEATGRGTSFDAQDGDRILDVAEATYAVLKEVLDVPGLPPDLRKRVEAAMLDMQYVGEFVTERINDEDDGDDEDEGEDGGEDDGDEDGDDGPDEASGSAPALVEHARRPTPGTPRSRGSLPAGRWTCGRSFRDTFRHCCGAVSAASVRAPASSLEHEHLQSPGCSRAGGVRARSDGTSARRRWAVDAPRGASAGDERILRAPWCEQPRASIRPGDPTTTRVGRRGRVRHARLRPVCL